jgi:hypothetical protein
VGNIVTTTAQQSSFLQYERRSAAVARTAAPHSFVDDLALQAVAHRRAAGPSRPPVHLAPATHLAVGGGAGRRVRPATGPFRALRTDGLTADQADTTSAGDQPDFHPWTGLPAGRPMTNRAQHPPASLEHHRPAAGCGSLTRQLRSQAVPALPGPSGGVASRRGSCQGGEAVASMPIVDPAGTAEPCKTFTRQGSVKYPGWWPTPLPGRGRRASQYLPALCAVR